MLLLTEEGAGLWPGLGEEEAAVSPGAARLLELEVGGAGAGTATGGPGRGYSASDQQFE